MVNFINLDVSPGDRVIVPKSLFGLVQHHAICAGNGYIYENKAGAGVVLTPIGEFFKDAGQITEIRRFRGNQAQLSSVLSRAKSLLGKPYDLVNFNCEHFADFVQFGRPRSKQVETVAGIGFFALVLWGISKIASK